MSNEVVWRPLNVMAAEGMSLRVGAFRASDGEVVEFTPEVLTKVFNKVIDPIPMYLTHKGAGSSMPREVLGHAVKLGLENHGDKLHYKAVMMDPKFQLLYATGYDDTSAEITPIRDEAGNIIDGTLTGIAVVPNPAISGTDMKVSQLAFEAHKGPSGGNGMTGNKLQKTLLEAGMPADKVDSTIEGMRAYFSKEFEQAGLQAKLEEANGQIKLACSERDEMKKKFEEASGQLDTIYGGQVASLFSDIKGLKFENPEALVEGIPRAQQITMLSKLKEGLIAAKPASGTSVDMKVDPKQNPGTQKPAEFEALLSEMGLDQMWAQTHKDPVVI